MTTLHESSKLAFFGKFDHVVDKKSRKLIIVNSSFFLFFYFAYTEILCFIYTSMIYLLAYVGIITIFECWYSNYYIYGQFRCFVSMRGSIVSSLFPTLTGLGLLLCLRSGDETMFLTQY